MNKNYHSSDGSGRASRRSPAPADSDQGTNIPPPMPGRVSFANDERATSLPAASARHLPGNQRAVSFSDSITSFNFPVASAPNAFPGRIVSQVTRKSSLESLQEFDLSFSSLSSFNAEETFDKKPASKSPADSVFEPNQIFASKTSAFNNCRDDDLRTILHRACQQFPRKKGVVKGALKRDPSAVRRRAFIPGVPAKGKLSSKGDFNTTPPEPYQLPINIALAHNASLDVLDLLVKADANQLTQKDGIHGSNSLCLALEKRPNDIAVLGMFLVSNPELIRHNNTPLHVACQRGSNLPIIRQLFQLYPAALFHRNETGKTPLDILEQHAQVCPKAKTALTFLQEKATLLQHQKGGQAQR